MAYNPNPALVSAIRQYGGDLAPLLLATTLVESGGRLDAVGDGGMSIGPYQMHSRGRGYGVAPARRKDPVFSTQSALAEFKRFRSQGYSGAELAYRAQRPADHAGYVRKIQSALPEAQRILGMAAGPTTTTPAPAAAPRAPRLTDALRQGTADAWEPIPLSPEADARINDYLLSSRLAVLDPKTPLPDVMPLYSYLESQPRWRRIPGTPAVAGPTRQAASLPGSLTGASNPVRFKMGGGPDAHGSRALGNWQSDNAYDLMGNAGDSVYSPIVGTVTKISGAPGSPRGAQFAGYGITVKTANGELFFKHLGTSNVKVGDKISPGMVIGTLEPSTQGGPHLHLGGTNSGQLSRLATWYTSAARGGGPTRTAQSVAGGTYGPSGGWGGSEGPVKSMESIAAGFGLHVNGEKRDNLGPNGNPASGSRSDHHIGNKNAFAADLGWGGSRPTGASDKAASAIVSALGGPANWGRSGGNYRVTVNGVRWQIIYRSNVGGNHWNHIHVGARVG